MFYTATLAGPAPSSWRQGCAADGCRVGPRLDGRTAARRYGYPRGREHAPPGEDDRILLAVPCANLVASTAFVQQQPQVTLQVAPQGTMQAKAPSGMRPADQRSGSRRC